MELRMTSSTECFHRAEGCELQARKATSGYVRRAFLETAEQWRSLGKAATTRERASVVKEQSDGQ